MSRTNQHFGSRSLIDDRDETTPQSHRVVTTSQKTPTLRGLSRSVIWSLSALVAIVLLVTLAGTTIAATSTGAVDSGISSFSNSDNSSIADGQLTHRGDTAKLSTAGEQHSIAGVADDRATNGTETVLLVQFDRTQVGPSDDTTDELTIERLQNRTAVQQAPLKQYAANTTGVTVERTFWLGNIAVLRVEVGNNDDAESSQSIAREVAQIENVESVSRDERVYSNRTVGTAERNGGLFPVVDSVDGDRLRSDSPRVHGTDTTYGVDQVNAPEVWDTYETEGEGASIAVLDTGVDPDHPDIELAKWGEWDTNGNPINTSPQDYGIHGTPVSGIVTGGAESGTHIGVAPDAELYHGAVLTTCREFGCFGYWSQIIGGMQWAVAQDVDVISMSLGGSNRGTEYIEPVRDAVNLGTAVVASIGNDGEGTSDSPGDLYDVISAGASDSDNDIRPFSGGEVVPKDEWSESPSDWPAEWTTPTVAAAGSFVESAVPGGGYGSFSGTSTAAPHVSGVIALVQSATDHHVPVTEMRTGLTETAYKPPGEDPEPDTRYGHGIVDAMAALDSGHVNDGTITGTVSADDGTVLAEANVTLVDNGTVFGSTQTTSAGAYTIQAAPGTYTLVVTKLGFEQTSTEVSVELGETHQYNATLPPAEPGTVTGVVTDLDDDPVDGAELRFYYYNKYINSSISNSTGMYTAELYPGTYEVTVDRDGFSPSIFELTLSANETMTRNVELSEGPPSLPGFDSAPRDLSGDNLYEDIDGDGEFDIFDVQGLFTYLDSDPVQNFPDAFSFNHGGNNEKVTIFDVQALFHRLVHWDEG